MNVSAHPRIYVRPGLWSSDLILYVPSTRLKGCGDLAFSAIAPRLWNSLASSLRKIDELETFNSGLKTLSWAYQATMHRRTGRVSFRGAEVSCPNIVTIACTKIKWFSRILPVFCPKMAIWQILGGGGGGRGQPHGPYAYATMYSHWLVRGASAFECVSQIHDEI